MEQRSCRLPREAGAWLEMPVAFRATTTLELALLHTNER